jgi:hypothetical protein
MPKQVLWGILLASIFLAGIDLPLMHEPFEAWPTYWTPKL